MQSIGLKVYLKWNPSSLVLTNKKSVIGNFYLNIGALNNSFSITAIPIILSSYN